MAVPTLPTPAFSSGYDYNYGKEFYSQAGLSGMISPGALYTDGSQNALAQWGNYPSQIGPVNSAMNSLFPPFSRGSTQKVFIQIIKYEKKTLGAILETLRYVYEYE